jgi:lysozyme family protein
MSDFDKAFELVVGVEGGYGKDPNDAGNWTGGKVGAGELKGTKYGISAAAYPKLNIAGLTIERAKAIYWQDYWKPVRGDDLGWPLSLAMFDAAVQHDPRDAAMLLQRAIGANPDGDIGPATLAQVRAIGPAEAAALLMRQRLGYYRSLKTWPRYGDGWTNRLFRVAFAA